jgi:hypothetical protein
VTAHDLLFHGGVPGRKVGDVLLPGMAEHRYVEGCACCEAHRDGLPAFDPATPLEWVYACADRPYARFYASRAVRGTLYRVRLEGDVERSAEDPAWFWAYRGRQARVVAVLETNVVLTMTERQKLFVRWGGSREEFDQMVRAVVAGAEVRQ